MALKVLKQVMEEKLDENNVQLAQVRGILFRYALVLILGLGDKRKRLPDSGRIRAESSYRGDRGIAECTMI